MAKGLTFEAAQAGAPLTAAQKAEFDAAISRLEAVEKVVGITGDCGFLMNYQREARRQATLPCFISAVMQCHILSCAYALEEEFLVLTANGESLRPSFDKMLDLAHVTDPARKVRVRVRVSGRFRARVRVREARTLPIAPTPTLTHPNLSPYRKSSIPTPTLTFALTLTLTPTLTLTLILVLALTLTRHASTCSAVRMSMASTPLPRARRSSQ